MRRLNETASQARENSPKTSSSSSHKSYCEGNQTERVRNKKSRNVGKYPNYPKSSCSVPELCRMPDDFSCSYSDQIRPVPPPPPSPLHPYLSTRFISHFNESSPTSLSTVKHMQEGRPHSSACPQAAHNVGCPSLPTACSPSHCRVPARQPCTQAQRAAGGTARGELRAAYGDWCILHPPPPLPSRSPWAAVINQVLNAWLGPGVSALCGWTDRQRRVHGVLVAAVCRASSGQWTGWGGRVDSEIGWAVR